MWGSACFLFPQANSWNSWSSNLTIHITIIICWGVCSCIGWGGSSFLLFFPFVAVGFTFVDLSLLVFFFVCFGRSFCWGAYLVVPVVPSWLCPSWFDQWCIHPMDACISCICCSVGSPPTHVLLMLCTWSILFVWCNPRPCVPLLCKESTWPSIYWSQAFSFTDITLAWTPGPTHIIIGMDRCMPLCLHGGFIGFFFSQTVFFFLLCLVILLHLILRFSGDHLFFLLFWWILLTSSWGSVGIVTFFFFFLCCTISTWWGYIFKF